MNRWQPRQELVVIICFSVGLYMTSVDSTIIYTALPSLARGFHEPLSAAQWVTLGYLLSLAVLVPSSGWIGDKFGTRRTYIFALVLFTAASAACGLSESLLQLVIFRVVQGIGGGLIIPVGQAMLFRTFPPERRAKAAGMAALGTALGPATGPVLGGVLVTELSWRWCFYVNIPIGLFVLTLAVLFLGEHREPAAGRLDIPGFLLAGSGLALFLYAVSESPTLGWTSPAVIGSGIAGLAALVALVWVELHSAAPMLNLRLLHNRIFRTTCLVSLCSMCAYSGYLFIMPEFLQQARGASALSSGLTTLPGAVGLWMGSQTAARIYKRAGPRRMALAGLGTVATIFILLGLTIDLNTSTWLIRLLAFCSGFGIACCNVAVQTSSFATISPSDTGRASALFQTQTRVAGGLGVAVLVTVISTSYHGGVMVPGTALVLAFHHAFFTAAGSIVVAGLIALRIRDSDAAATLRRPAPPPVAPEPVPVVGPAVQPPPGTSARPG